MSVYRVDGNELLGVYSVNGAELQNAYNYDGDLVFTAYVILKIMSYNVGQWYIGDTNRVPVAKKEAYYLLQHGTFENNPADVLFIQEYLNSWCDDDSPASDLFGSYFDDQEITNPTGYIGHSICTNGYEISNYTSHDFTSNSGSYPTFETATITVDGKTIHIINTHNDFRSTYQEQNVTDLLNAVSQFDYFILCGDFNIDLTAESHSTISSQYYNNIQRFLDAGYNVGNCVIDWINTYYGTESPTGGKCTDQIVTSSNIRILSIQAYTEKLTDGIGDKIDHLPLIAEIAIH